MISMPASRISTFFGACLGGHHFAILANGRRRHCIGRLRQLRLQVDVGLAAAKELAEHPLEVLAHQRERLLESLGAFVVDRVDQLLELLLRLREILDLFGQECLPLLQLILLADRVEIDVAQPLNLLLELPNLFGNGVPVHLRRLIAALLRQLGPSRGQIELNLFHRPLNQTFNSNPRLAGLHLELVHRLRKLRMLPGNALDLRRELGQRLAAGRHFDGQLLDLG